MVPDRPDRQRRLVAVATAVTILLGLAFVFIRAPHPFGWAGIDHYDDIALRLAHGESFPTTEVPWGYAYFLAFFYRIAGNRPWVPLVAQVLLNGLIPPLLYYTVKPALGGRAATLAALLVSVLSFNTVYASTQSSDSMCTVVFLAGLAAFTAALRRGPMRLFAASGLLAGLASQFRPNLILLPPVLAAAALAFSERTIRRAAALVVYVAFATLVSVPWVVRNYRLTGEVIPTSTHGGVQWWYGTLETGAYLHDRAHNPRSLFEASAFDYTSLAGRSLVVSASRPCDDGARAALRFWTDRDTTPHVAARTADPDPTTIAFTIPGQPNHTVVYYYFSVPRADGGAVTTPEGGAGDPFVFFVDDRHVEDLDRHGDLIDAFDAVRALQGDAPSESALAATLAALLPSTPPHFAVARNRDAAVLQFGDGSTFAVPRAWSGRLTDVTVTPGIAARLLYERRRSRGRPAGRIDECRTLERIAVNDVFYRREPHMQRRYAALAWDNIRRDPVAYVAASVYRAFRLFVVQGTSDSSNAWQFSGSRMVYTLAMIASAAYLLLAAAGVVIAMRRGADLWMLLTPVLYIPATICFVLINMRYTITVQPLLLAFGATALTASGSCASASGTRPVSLPA